MVIVQVPSLRARSRTCSGISDAVQPRHDGGDFAAAAGAVVQGQLWLRQRGGQSVCGAAAHRGSNLPAARMVVAGLLGGSGWAALRCNPLPSLLPAPREG